MEDPQNLARCIRNECKKPIDKHIYGMCLECYDITIIQPRRESIDRLTQLLAEYYRKKTDYENLTIDRQTFTAYCDAHNAPILTYVAILENELQKMEAQCQKYLEEYAQYQNDYSAVEGMKGYRDVDFDNYINSRNPALKPFFDKYNNMVHDILKQKIRFMHNAHQFSDYGSSCNQHHPLCINEQRFFANCCLRHMPVCLIFSQNPQWCVECYNNRVYNICNCSKRLEDNYKYNERDLKDTYRSLKYTEKYLQSHLAVLYRV